MSLNNIFKSKILRPVDNDKLGILIRNIEAMPENNSVVINCRYFDLTRSEDGLGDIDVFIIPMMKFLDSFMLMSNADEIDKFELAKWEPLDKYVDKWLDDNWGDDNDSEE